MAGSMAVFNRETSVFRAEVIKHLPVVTSS
jgi:hypothetical protein